MLSPLWQAKWQTVIVRRCRKGKEFISRNVFTSRYVIICGLSEFMINYRRGLSVPFCIGTLLHQLQKEINYSYIYCTE